MGLLSIIHSAARPEKTKVCKCKEPDYEVRGGDDIHMVHCNLCGGERKLHHLLNNLIERMKKLESK